MRLWASCKQPCKLGCLYCGGRPHHTAIMHQSTTLALPPSLPHRELLGKYAASSGGGLSMHPLSSAPASGTPRLGSGSAGPRGATPSYLSPAFQLAAMEQEVQMAHASAAAAQQGGGANGDTPPAAPGWQADDASELGQGGNSSLVCTVHAAPLARRASCMLHEHKEPPAYHANLPPHLHGPPAPAVYNALTATAKKLADKPSFMEAYRQKFPHISECWAVRLHVQQ